MSKRPASKEISVFKKKSKASEPIFKDLVFVCSNNLCKPASTIEQLVVDNGGIFSTIITKDYTTHFLMSDNDFKDRGHALKLTYAKGYQIPIVHEDFLFDSLANDKLLDPREYDFSVRAQQEWKPKSKAAADEQDIKEEEESEEHTEETEPGDNQKVSLKRSKSAEKNEDIEEVIQKQPKQDDEPSLKATPAGFSVSLAQSVILRTLSALPSEEKFVGSTPSLEQLVEAHEAEKDDVTETSAKSANTTEAAVYLATVGEYVCAELMEAAGLRARQDVLTIEPYHLFLAVNEDEELKKAFSNPRNRRQAQKVKDAIRKKPNWQLKVGESSIAAKWFDEATAQGVSGFDFFSALVDLQTEAGSKKNEAKLSRKKKANKEDDKEAEEEGDGEEEGDEAEGDEAEGEEEEAGKEEEEVEKKEEAEGKVSDGEEGERKDETPSEVNWMETEMEEDAAKKAEKAEHEETRGEETAEQQEGQEEPEEIVEAPDRIEEEETQEKESEDEEEDDEEEKEEEASAEQNDMGADEPEVEMEEVANTYVPGVIWQSDAVPDELRIAVQSQLDQMADRPEKDWHPGSKKQVLDLIHPSLFCYVKGVSPIVNQVASAAAPRKTDVWGRKYETSKFQWLPAEFSVSESGEAKLESYINNLNTFDFPALPNDIAKVFSHMVPLLEQVRAVPEISEFPDSGEELPDQLYSDRLKACWENVKKAREILRELDKESASKERMIEFIENLQLNAPGEREWVASESDSSDHEEETQTEVEEKAPEKWGDSDDDDEENQKGSSTWVRYKLCYLEQQALESINQERYLQLRGKRVQVIVKAANIIVTKRDPIYRGGSWHVEGMSHEHIAASAIWYYDAEGVTDSYLAFRQKISAPPRFFDDPPEDIFDLYHVRDGEALNKELGMVHTVPRGAIAFPNGLQHQVQDFKLRTGSEVGVRKILCFFVIDERFTIPSSACVLPQQPWFNLPQWENKLVEFLPAHVAQLVVSYVAPGMSLEVAQRYRRKLMKERKVDVDERNEEFEREFSLCEH